MAAVVPTQPTTRTEGPSVSFRNGWVFFAVSLAARMYLTLLLSLAIIATVPYVFGWSSFLVTSGSMQPNIREGDVVVTSGLDRAVNPLGAVVAFHANNRTSIRIHRIVYGNDDGSFTTAGDANADVDTAPLRRAQIVGQGRLLVPFIGLPAWWLSSGQWMPLTVWGLGTSAAVAVLIVDASGGAGRSGHSGRSALGRRERGDLRGAGGGEAGEGGADEGGREEAEVSDNARRSLLLAAGGIVALGLLALPRQHASAAFTARTGMRGNTFAVAVVVEPTISVGRLAPYALLGSSKVTDASAGSHVTGSVGVTPGTAITGFNRTSISGSVDANNAAARGARTDADALNAKLNALGTTKVIPAQLSGTLRPGVYQSTTASFHVVGTLTLDAGGDPSAVFVFKANSFSVAASARMVLAGGARAVNVFGRIDNALTLSKASVAVGTYVCRGSVTLDRATLTGRAVSLDSSVACTRSTISVP